MAEFTSRDVTTVRREFVLRRPTNWAEVDKVKAAISQELKQLDLSESDDRVNVDSDDDGPVGVEVLGAVKVTIDGRTVLPVSKLTVTRAQVRAVSSALFEWNNELAGDPSLTLHHVTGGVAREPYGALVDEVLHHLGIRIQEGQQP